MERIWGKGEDTEKEDKKKGKVKGKTHKGEVRCRRGNMEGKDMKMEVNKRNGKGNESEIQGKSGRKQRER